MQRWRGASASVEAKGIRQGRYQEEDISDAPVYAAPRKEARWGLGSSYIWHPERKDGSRMHAKIIIKQSRVCTIQLYPPCGCHRGQGSGMHS